MSHLINTLGHKVAITAKNAVPYFVVTLFAIYLVANIPSYVSGTLVSGLSAPYWFGTAVVGLVIVLALFATQADSIKREVTNDHD